MEGEIAIKPILVTGGAGFIGANFIHRAMALHADWLIVNLDALTYAGNLQNLQALQGNPRHIFVHGDIADRERLAALFARYGFEWVINFAAQTHVDRSIREPEVFVRTNVLGTQCLLDAARAGWQSGTDAHGRPAYRAGVQYLQISTDEVYGSLGATGTFTETTPLAPNSPYAASKAAADLLVRAYYKTYRLPAMITRCSNNYGPYQFPEKLIPLMITSALDGRPLPLYGDGMQVRDWLHVHDHITAIDAVLRKGRAGQIYNIGGNNPRTNIEIARLILGALGKPESLIAHVDDRPGHDQRYAVDSTKITTELGWQPAYTFAQGLADTIGWYLGNRAWLDAIQNGTYRQPAPGDL